MLLLHLITTHLVSHLSLSSIVFIISTLIIGIFCCLDHTLLLLHLLMAHLVIDVRINICFRQLLRTPLKWVLWPGFLQKIDWQSSTSSNDRYVASTFFKFGEIIVEYFTKGCFAFLRIAFITFLWSFFNSSQKRKIRAMKDIKRNFTSNNLNQKKSEHPFVKKLICEHLAL